jgi:hypothetical protein
LPVIHIADGTALRRIPIHCSYGKDPYRTFLL